MTNYYDVPMWQYLLSLPIGIVLFMLLRLLLQNRLINKYNRKHQEWAEDRRQALEFFRRGMLRIYHDEQEIRDDYESKKPKSPIIHWHWAVFNIGVALLHGLVLTSDGLLNPKITVQTAWIMFYSLILCWIIFDLLWNVTKHGWAGWNYVDSPDPGEDDAWTDIIAWTIAEKLGLPPWTVQYFVKIDLLILCFYLSLYYA